MNQRSSISREMALGINGYSMLGWCNSRSIALIASRAADRVDKLVVWSCNAFIAGKDLKVYETTRDVHSCPDQWKLPQFKMYGKKYMSDKWSEWIDASRTILNCGGGDVCINALAQIDAPTLILHGAHDVVEIFPDGKHIIHFMFPKKFNSLVDNFLTTIQ